MRQTALDALIEPPSRALARLRRGRALHRDGVTRVGAAIIGPTELPIATGPVTVRVSKGIGAPGGIPDLVGVAARFEPHGWDLLMTGPVHRIAGIPVPFPARRWSGLSLSPLMKFRYGGATWRLSGRLVTPPVRSGFGLRDLADALDAGNAALTLAASRNGGPWTAIGTVEFGDVPASGDIAFDPTGSVPTGIQPIPVWLARLRHSGYRGSRQGRH